VIDLSILTPVYNGEKYIENCLSNVQAQDCSRAEHIIIDGGSMDGSLDLARQYSQKYPHIRLISEQDRGQSDALNKGIAISRGRILGILNVDDTYEPGVLNRVLGLLDGLPEPALVVGNCNVWDTHRQLMLVNKPKKLAFADLLLGQNVNPFPVNPSAYFYHKSLHDIIGPYDVDEHYTMDLDFLLRAVQSAHVHYYDEVWGNFNLHSQTKTYLDIERGSTLARQADLLKKYTSLLPFHQRLMVRLKYHFYNGLVGPIKYFSQYPEELPTRLKARLIGSSGE
jgi:glycosyltransferase involved in cell wall biosynthesis